MSGRGDSRLLPRDSRRRPRALLGAAALLLAAAAAPIGAQQSGEADIFNTQTFDQSVAVSRQQEQAHKLEYLVGGVFLLDNTIVAAQRFDGYAANGAFSAKAFARLSVPSYGTLYLGYILRHVLYQGDGGTLDSTLPGADLFENTYALSEFYLSFDLAKKVFVRLGNQLIAWGPSLIWTPVDFVNLQRLDPLATLDLRVGKPGLRVHVPMKNSNLFLGSIRIPAMSSCPAWLTLVKPFARIMSYSVSQVSPRGRATLS